jgi:hypothetical protein
MSAPTPTSTCTNLDKEYEIDNFKNNINHFLKKDNLPNEIIKIAEFVNDNPYIIQNIIDNTNPLRCIACCYNKQQCSKNKKKNSDFCGVHKTATPYGIIQQKDDQIVQIDVTLTEIKGILCFIDNLNNIYEMEDIIKKKINPKVIARLIDGVYTSVFFV